MNPTSPIYTEKNNCQDCYKCIRQCPVKAIRIIEANASVIPEDCIYCGHCVQVCPVNAKKVRNDLHLLKQSLKQNTKIIAAFAPSYLAEFDFNTIKKLINAIVQAGFMGVSETALGAEIVSKQTKGWLQDQPNGIYIASCCTSLVTLIRQRYSHLSDKLVPVLSPMQAHAKLLKQIYGNDIEVAFFGPCIAKKHEIDSLPGITDYVLTFKDLDLLLESLVPNWKNNDMADEREFIPFKAGKGNFFPVDGGMIANLKKDPSITETSYMAFSGINAVKEVLDDIQNWNINDKLFLELLICEGGCIKGPGTINNASLVQKRFQLFSSVETENKNKIHLSACPDINIKFPVLKTSPEIEFSNADIENALKASGKFSIQDELNCGGCGYDSCREFAKAMLAGKAERIMCVSYTRKVAQDKASLLLKKIPYGVVMVDDQLKVIDANQKFIDMFGNKMDNPISSLNELTSQDLISLFFAYRLFSTVIHTGDELVDQIVRGEGMFLNVSIVTIQPHKIVCGIIQNMHEPEVRNELINKSVREVIRQNTDVVQKIAFLLGENASYTQSVLNTLIEANSNEPLK